MNEKVEEVAVYTGIVGTAGLIGYGAYANARDKIIRAKIQEQKLQRKRDKYEAKMKAKTLADEVLNSNASPSYSGDGPETEPKLSRVERRKSNSTVSRALEKLKIRR